MGNGIKSAKRCTLKRDVRVGWVIDVGEPSHYKRVSFCGTASEVDDPETVYLRLTPEDGRTWEY